MIIRVENCKLYVSLFNRLWEVIPIMQEWCLKCGLRCLGRNIVLLFPYYWIMLTSKILLARRRRYGNTYGEGELNFGIDMAQRQHSLLSGP